MDYSAAETYPDNVRVTLPATGAQAVSVQAVLLVAASVLLPAAVHLAGWPARQLLPMHWPVILVGLVYGWRSGLAVGLAAPALSYAISGMPVAAMLPAMTVELAAYGLIAGVARESFRLNAFVAAAAAVIGGRIVFVVMAMLTGAVGPSAIEYVRAALLPGLAAAAAQVLVLPFIAGWWVQRRRGA